MGAALGSYSALVAPAPLQPLPCGSQCGGPATLDMDAERVELNLPCRRFVHEGSWAFDAQGRADLLGRWQQLVQTAGRTVMEQQSVRLTLQVEGSAQLWLTVTDLAGMVVLGPLLLQQGSERDAASPCL